MSDLERLEELRQQASGLNLKLTLSQRALGIWQVFLEGPGLDRVVVGTGLSDRRRAIEQAAEWLAGQARERYPSPASSASPSEKVSLDYLVSAWRQERELRSGPPTYSELDPVTGLPMELMVPSHYQRARSGRPMAHRMSRWARVKRWLLEPVGFLR